MALLRASLLARDNKLKEAESVLASASDAGDAPQELTLMRAQLAVDNANNAQVRTQCMQLSRCKFKSVSQSALTTGLQCHR